MCRVLLEKCQTFGFQVWIYTGVENTTKEMRLQKQVRSYDAYLVLGWTSSWNLQRNPGKTVPERGNSVPPQAPTVCMTALTFLDSTLQIFLFMNFQKDYENLSSLKYLNRLITFILSVESCRCFHSWHIINGENFKIRHIGHSYKYIPRKWKPYSKLITILLESRT